SAHWPAASRLAPAIPKSRPVAPWSYTVPVGPTEGYMLSATSSLPQRSLHNGIEHAEKPGAVSLGYRSWSAGTRSELPQVPRNLTTDKCVTIFACVHCLPVEETTRAPLLRQRDASGISEVTHTSADEMCSTIQSSAASALSPTRIILTFEIPGGRIGLDPLETTKTMSRRRAATR